MDLNLHLTYPNQSRTYCKLELPALIAVATELGALGGLHGPVQETRGAAESKCRDVCRVNGMKYNKVGSARLFERARQQQCSDKHQRTL